MMIDKLQDVVDWRLCLGCGACAYICTERNITLFDFIEEGIRPVVGDGNCAGCRDCLDVCPAVRSDYRHDSSKCVDSIASPEFQDDWGPVTGIWEGHATDEEIRYKGSSGGVLTALSAYCLEQLGMHGVLHIAADTGDPLRNRTRLSRSRADLLSAVGSRYAPASIGNGLALVEQASAPCVIIGKPAEISAVRNARALRPRLDRNVGLTLSFFCAESPATRGTVALLEKLETKPEQVSELRYRGNGWPGHFAPTLRGESEPFKQLTYRESWSFLQAYRPWSVHQWPDGSGELADISCGDPWYEEPNGQNPGFSLVVARTQIGREIVEGAMRAGYLKLTVAEPWKLAKSQPNLLLKKGMVWGRRWATSCFRLPVTQLVGLNLKRCWDNLSWQEKLKSTFGTLRRILQRRLYRRLQLNHVGAVRVPVADDGSFMDHQ